MLNRLVRLCFIIFFVASVSSVSAAVDIVPMPARIEKSGASIVCASFRIKAPKTLAGEAALLKEALSRQGYAEGKGLKITLALDEKLSSEAYDLRISSDKGIEITGGDAAGVFYGTCSLLQLINASSDGILECLHVQDQPRYAWRGYMLDESRHFFGVEKVKQLLDVMAYYKLNKFHWHLTDEPAWRIEIKRYPLLTTVGGTGSWSDPNLPAAYYTQEQIRDIVAYAAARHIEVIPEIDMPGHATAANRAYPELTGGGTPDHPDFTFNPGKEEVYAFLTNVLREVSALFPSSYLHLGGDEVSFGIKAWETDPDVQALLKREGLDDVKGAERYFMLRMADSVKMLGKQLLGWDELLEIGVKSENTVIMWWRHDRPGQLKKSVSKNYKTVLCPRRPLYFDFIQRQGDKWGRVWNGFNPLEDVYRYPDTDLDSWNLPETEEDCIMGLQANLWTERVQNEERVDYMTFPRLCALAEAAWTSREAKDFDSFIRRMEHGYRLFDRLGIRYFRPDMKEPAGPVRKGKEVPMDFRD